MQSTGPTTGDELPWPVLGLPITSRPSAVRLCASTPLSAASALQVYAVRQDAVEPNLFVALSSPVAIAKFRQLTRSNHG